MPAAHLQTTGERGAEGGAGSVEVPAGALRPAPATRGTLLETWHELFLHHDRAVLKNESAV